MASNPALNPSTFDVVKLRGESVTINSQDLTVLLRDTDGNVLMARGLVTISDGGSGFAKGATYRKTDVATGVSGLYENVGTTTSCNFDLIGQNSGAGGGGGTPGSMDSVYDVGHSIGIDGGPIILTDATTGALDTLQLTQTGAKSGDILEINVNAALTGKAVRIDMDLGIAADAIFIDSGATARTGSDVRFNDDSTAAHSLIDIEKSGSGASIGIEYVGSYAGSPAGQVSKITFNNAACLDTEVEEVNTGTGDRAIMFDYNFGHTDSGTTSHIWDIDLSAIFDSNVFDVAFAAASTGNVFNAVMDNAVAATAIRVTGAGVRTQPFIELISTATGTADMIDLSADGAFTGDVIDMDLTTAVGARGIAFTGAGARTANIIDITDSSTSNTEMIDINVSGVNTGNILDITYSAAATGTMVALALGSGVGAKALSISGGNVTRTVAMGLITLDGAGATAGSTFLDINVTNTGATAAGVFDIDVSGIYTGAVIDIAYSAAATGDAIVVDLTSALDAKFARITGAGARVDDIFEINDSSTGNSHVFDINMSGVYTGNILDITFASAAATSSAIKLAMGTNVAGQAIEISSAATGVTGEGSVFDVEHTGNLVAGASLMDIHTTGSPSSTSHVLKITQDTGAGSAGAFGLYISCTGTNVEALKVDDGTVTFDETLTVTGGIAGALVYSGSQALSGAGAVTLTNTVTKFTSTGGAQALTLADGVDGQVKIIVHDVDGGSGVLTPATATGYTTITFTNAGDTVTLLFVTTRGWVVTGSKGVTIA